MKKTIFCQVSLKNKYIGLKKLAFLEFEL